jgi:hypothetical protein
VTTRPTGSLVVDVGPTSTIRVEPTTRAVPAWLQPQRSLTDELASHLDEYTIEADGVVRVRWEGRTFLLIVAPQVCEVTP